MTDKALAIAVGRATELLGERRVILAAIESAKVQQKAAAVALSTAQDDLDQAEAESAMSEAPVDLRGAKKRLALCADSSASIASRLAGLTHREKDITTKLRLAADELSATHAEWLQDQVVQARQVFDAALAQLRSAAHRMLIAARGQHFETPQNLRGLYQQECGVDLFLLTLGAPPTEDFTELAAGINGTKAIIEQIKTATQPQPAAVAEAPSAVPTPRPPASAVHQQHPLAG